MLRFEEWVSWWSLPAVCRYGRGGIEVAYDRVNMRLEVRREAIRHRVYWPAVERERAKSCTSILQMVIINDTQRFSLTGKVMWEIESLLTMKSLDPSQPLQLTWQSDLLGSTIQLAYSASKLLHLHWISISQFNLYFGIHFPKWPYLLACSMQAAQPEPYVFKRTVCSKVEHSLLPPMPPQENGTCPWI